MPGTPDPGARCLPLDLHHALHHFYLKTMFFEIVRLHSNLIFALIILVLRRSMTAGQYVFHVSIPRSLFVFTKCAFVHVTSRPCVTYQCCVTNLGARDGQPAFDSLPPTSLRRAGFPVIPSNQTNPMRTSRCMYPPTTMSAITLNRAKFNSLLTAWSSLSSMWVVSPRHLANLEKFYSPERTEDLVIVILRIVLSATIHDPERHIYDHRPRYSTQLDGHTA